MDPGRDRVTDGLDVLGDDFYDGQGHSQQDMAHLLEEMPISEVT